MQRLLQKLHSILSALSTESFIRCCRLYRQRASFDSVGFIDGELHSIFCVAFILFSVLFRDLICFIRRLHRRLNTRVNCSSFLEGLRQDCDSTTVSLASLVSLEFLLLPSESRSYMFLSVELYAECFFLRVVVTVASCLVQLKFV